MALSFTSATLSFTSPALVPAARTRSVTPVMVRGRCDSRTDALELFSVD